MAIKFKYGRITKPQGTYLSNPSTAADGGLGGPQGMNPGTMGDWGYSRWNPLPGRYTSFTSPTGATAGLYGLIPSTFAQPPIHYDRYANTGIRGGPRPGGPNAPATNFLNTLRGWLGMSNVEEGTIPPIAQVMQNYGYVAPGEKPKEYVSPFTSTSAPTYSVPTGTIPAYQANQAGALDGLTPVQVQQTMVQNGYTQKWVEGVGMTWFKSGGPVGASAYGASKDSRPEWVDGASLQPGESVVDANGTRYVGGTPAPDGTAQYSVSYANPAARDDKHGKYKWVSEVRKDSNGNWVRINRQVVRKVYTRSHLKKVQGRREQQQQDAAAAQGSGQNYNQLVNLRVNYG